MKKALKMALEALEENHEEIVHNWALFEKNKNAIYAIKEVLAQPDQEPVAWMVWGENNVPSLTFKKPSDKYVFDSLYTTPPQRKPLTDEEMKKIWYAMQNIMGWYSFEEVARAIEAAHGIKE